MARIFLLPGLLGGIVMLFWLWALIDVILTDSILIRNMQKGTWIFLVVFVPTFGAVAWLLFGRPEGATLAPGGTVSYDQNPYRSERRVIGAEDSSTWSRPESKPSRPTSGDEESLAVRERRLMEREAELARREQELADGTGSSDADSEPGGDTPSS